MSLAYRLRQLRTILIAGPLPDEARREIAATLSGPERALFDHYTPGDQWHAYRVLRMLRDAGYNDPDLLVAALLHDVGKTRCPLSAWDRTLIVVAQALVPQRMAAWGEGAPEGWRRPFVVRAQHAAWGAAMAEAAGSRPAVVDLIRRHQDKPGEGDAWLTRLQWADDQN